MAVHQDCYGIQNIPEGSWYCSVCTEHGAGKVKCALCGVAGGALKRDSDTNEWIHVQCAL